MKAVKSVGGQGVRSGLVEGEMEFIERRIGELVDSGNHWHKSCFMIVAQFLGCTGYGWCFSSREAIESDTRRHGQTIYELWLRATPEQQDKIEGFRVRAAGKLSVI